MNIILVPGQTCSPTGEIDPNLKLKLAYAIRLMRNDKNALLVIAGGVTMPGQLSEAEGGMMHIPPDLFSRVRLEKRSLSTGQNVKFTKELLKDTPIDSITVISKPRHGWRVRWFFERMWPEVMDRFLFIPVGDDGRLYERFEHNVINVITFMHMDEAFLKLKKIRNRFFQF